MSEERRVENRSRHYVCTTKAKSVRMGVATTLCMFKNENKENGNMKLYYLAKVVLTEEVNLIIQFRPKWVRINGDGVKIITIIA